MFYEFLCILIQCFNTSFYFYFKSQILFLFYFYQTFENGIFNLNQCKKNRNDFILFSDFIKKNHFNFVILN